MLEDGFAGVLVVRLAMKMEMDFVRMQRGEKMDDSISRQSVRDTIYRIRCELQMMDDSQTADKMMSGVWLVEKAIKQLPSAQPEIIRCKDCKHSEHWYRDKSRCFLWNEEGIGVFDDGFCSYAERRTDETD